MPVRIPYTCRALFAALCVLACLALGGCATQPVVPMIYPRAETSNLPVLHAPRFIVIDFDNMRTTPAIGTLRDGTTLKPRTLVERWVAEAIAAELRRRGYAAVAVENFAQALATKPDFIVSGDLEEVWIQQASITRYSSSLRMTVALMNGRGKNLTANNYNGTFTQFVLPGIGLPENLLPQALQEMLQSSVRDILTFVEQN